MTPGFLQQGIAPLGQAQLAAWEGIARRWPTALDDHIHPWVWRCQSCERGIFLATDAAGNKYRYTPADRMALIVRHLRANHEDLDPDR